MIHIYIWYIHYVIHIYICICISVRWFASVTKKAIFIQTDKVSFSILQHHVVSSKLMVFLTSLAANKSQSNHNNSSNNTNHDHHGSPWITMAEVVLALPCPAVFAIMASTWVFSAQAGKRIWENLTAVSRWLGDDDAADDDNDEWLYWNATEPIL